MGTTGSTNNAVPDDPDPSTLPAHRLSLKDYSHVLNRNRQNTAAPAPAPAPAPPPRRPPAPPPAPARAAKWYWAETPGRGYLAAGASLPRGFKPPHWVPYDNNTAATLEKAFNDNNGEVRFGNYVVSLQTMKQINSNTSFERDVLRELQRPPRKSSAPPASLATNGRGRGRDGRGAARGNRGQGRGRGQKQRNRDYPPSYWDRSKKGKSATKHSVAPGSEEYTCVEKAFMLTLDDPSRDLKRDQFTIQSVERIQNMDLWRSYAAKRKSICERQSPRTTYNRNYVRNWLFHGCSGDITDKIVQQGFNRSFCGKNATMYGQGVYFARDASYSTYPLYSQRDTDGVQSIFLARVVVGEYCRGVKDAITPDVRDATTHALYDSTVDNVKDPSIFVTYNDAQAYPEYLIKYTQIGQRQLHPTPGEPANRDYRPNVFQEWYD